MKKGFTEASSFPGENGLIFKGTSTLWRNIMGCIEDNHNAFDEIKKNSLFFNRLEDTMSSIAWAMVSVYSAGYYSSLRNLRFWLEDAAQAYYLDQEMHTASRIEKAKAILQLEEKRVYGSKLIRKCKMSEEVRNKTLYLFKRLNKFAHTTDEILMDETDSSSHRWGSGEERFFICIELHHQVYDCITSMIIDRYSQAFKNHESSVVSLVIQLLNMLEYEFSLSLLGLEQQEAPINPENLVFF